LHYDRTAGPGGPVHRALDRGRPFRGAVPGTEWRSQIDPTASRPGVSAPHFDGGYRRGRDCVYLGAVWSNLSY